MAPNPRLEALAAPLLAEAQRQQIETGEKVRLVGETTYQADSWSRPRRVVYKAEALAKGPNTRCVVTSHPNDAPLARTAHEYSRLAHPRTSGRDVPVKDDLLPDAGVAPRRRGREDVTADPLAPFSDARRVQFNPGADSVAVDGVAQEGEGGCVGGHLEREDEPVAPANLDRQERRLHLV